MSASFIANTAKEMQNTLESRIDYLTNIVGQLYSFNKALQKENFDSNIRITQLENQACINTSLIESQQLIINEIGKTLGLLAESLTESLA